MCVCVCCVCVCCVYVIDRCCHHYCFSCFAIVLLLVVSFCSSCFLLVVLLLLLFWFRSMFLFWLHTFALDIFICIHLLRFCLVSLLVSTTQIRRNQSLKKREGDKDMMQVGNQNMLQGRVSPLSTLLPRVQHICLGSGIVETQILEWTKDNLLRTSTKPLFYSVLPLAIHVLGTC